MEALETHNLSFLDSAPPIKIVADKCGVITVNYRIVIEVSDHNTLQKKTEIIPIDGVLPVGGTL